MRIGIATCAAAPELDEDRHLLLPALARAGLTAIPAVWDDPQVDWTGFDAVLVRSVWDYPARHADFLAWLRSCPPTANPADVIRWNSDKHYLCDLADTGIATVPTTFLAPGQTLRVPAADFVVKPAIGGSAADTGRYRTAELHSAGSTTGSTAGSTAGGATVDTTVDTSAAALIARLHQQGRTVMLQPYLDGIDTEGETSLIYLAGHYSHAVTRRPLLTNHGERRPVVVADVLATIQPVTPTAAQTALAEAVLNAIPGGRHHLSYARVDLIPGPDGPLLLELEAIDSYLFLHHATATSIHQFANHVATQLTPAHEPTPDPADPADPADPTGLEDATHKAWN